MPETSRGPYPRRQPWRPSTERTTSSGPRELSNLTYNHPNKKRGDKRRVEVSETEQKDTKLAVYWLKQLVISQYILMATLLLHGLIVKAFVK